MNTAIYFLELLQQRLRTRFEQGAEGPVNKLYPLPSAVLSEELKDRIKQCSQDQIFAIYKAVMEDYNCLTILGEPGSGKSFIIGIIKDLLSLFVCSVKCLAPTNTAAQNIQGMTYQSYFGVKTYDVIPQPIPLGTKYLENKKVKGITEINYIEDSKKPSVIILDEISMVSSEALIAIYQLAAGKDSTKLIKFICIGDPQQLPPTDSSNIHTSAPWENAIFDTNDVQATFHSLLSESGPFIKELKWLNKAYANHYKEYAKTHPESVRLYDSSTFECLNNYTPWKALYAALTANHRQGLARRYINGIKALSLGLPLDGENIFNQRIIRESSLEKILPVKDKATHLFLRNVDAESLNWSCYNTSQEEKKIYYPSFSSKITGSGILTEVNTTTGEAMFLDSKTKKSKSIKLFYAKSLTIPLINPVYVGAPFIIRQNIPSLGVYNGTQSTVVELREESIVVELVKTRALIELKYCQMLDVPEAADGRPLAVIKTLPGHLAIGITVHKVQGLTLERDEARQQKDQPICVVHVPKWSAKFIGAPWLTVALSRTKSIEDLAIVTPDIGVLNECLKKSNISAINFLASVHEKSGSTLVTKEMRAGGFVAPYESEDLEESPFNLVVYQLTDQDVAHDLLVRVWVEDGEITKMAYTELSTLEVLCPEDSLLTFVSPKENSEDWDHLYPSVLKFLTKNNKLGCLV